MRADVPLMPGLCGLGDDGDDARRFVDSHQRVLELDLLGDKRVIYFNPTYRAPASGERTRGRAARLTGVDCLRPNSATSGRPVCPCEARVVMASVIAPIAPTGKAWRAGTNAQLR